MNYVKIKTLSKPKSKWQEISKKDLRLLHLQLGYVTMKRQIITIKWKKIILTNVWAQRFYHVIINCYLLSMLRQYHLAEQKAESGLKRKKKKKEIGFHPTGHLKNMEISIFILSGYRW